MLLQIPKSTHFAAQLPTFARTCFCTHTQKPATAFSRLEQVTAAVRRYQAAQRTVRVAATATADSVEDDVDDLDDGDTGDEEQNAEAQAGGETLEGSLEGLDFALNFLWMDKNIAIAVDQVFTKDQRSPVTEYYFWPRKDAWEELKVALEAKSWISPRDRVLLLNRTTEVINFWQTEGDKPTLQQAREQFPDCVFKGA